MKQTSSPPPTLPEEPKRPSVPADVLRAVANFVLPIGPETEGKNITYKYARFEIGADGALRIFCLDGKNLVIVTLPGVARDLSEGFFYVPREGLLAIDEDLDLFDLRSMWSSQEVPGYAMDVIGTQIKTQPSSLTKRVRTSRKALANIAAAVANHYQRANPNDHAAAVMAFTKDQLKIHGVLLASGKKEAPFELPSEPLVSSGPLPDNDSLWVAFNPDVLQEIAWLMDGEVVQIWAEPDTPRKPVLFRSAHRMVFAMPATRKDL